MNLVDIITSDIPEQLAAVENLDKVIEEAVEEGLKPVTRKDLLKLEIKVVLLEKRLDRLVDAVSKSKKTKGL